MILKRGNLVVEVDGERVIIYRTGSKPAVADLDEARWLAFVALPTFIAGVLSDPPAKVPDTAEGPIPGQTTIEDALA